MRPASILALAASLLSVASVRAQEHGGAIEGLVKDSSGGVMAGVVVEARSAALVGVARAVTDRTGTYRLPFLPPGVYEVSSTHPGFNRAKVVEAEITLGKTLRADLILSPAAVAETVEVVGESPVIDFKQSAAYTTIREEWLEKLPKGRNFTSVVSQAAGVNQERFLAGISIDGASAAENLYIIDGLDTTSLQSGLAAKSLVTDFVEEVQVKSSGYDAEFGASTGGVINVVTKTGGNQYEGEVVAYFLSDSFTGRERPTLQLGLVDDTQAEYVTYPKDDFTRWEPGGVVGGPIVPDRVWFFASYIPQLTWTSRNVTFRRNNRNATFHQHERTHHSTGKITLQPSAKTRAGFALNLSSYGSDGILPLKSGSGNPQANYDVGFRAPNLALSGHLDYLASERLFFSVRAGRFGEDYSNVGVPNEVRYFFVGSNAAFPEIPEALVRDNFFFNVATNYAVERDMKSRTSLHADATYYATAAGEHSLKFGVQFSRLANDTLGRPQQPYITLYWNRTLTTLSGERVRGPYGYYTYDDFRQVGDVHSNNLGFFVQDSWTIKTRLTLNLGLRSEREQVPSYTTEHGETPYPIEFGFQKKIAPRLGFAWDVRGNGKWKAFGSWGFFYDIMKLELPRGLFGADHWLQYRYSLDTFNWPQIGVNGNFPGTLYEVVDFRHQSNDPENSLIDPDLKPMRTREMAFGLEHELSRDGMVGVRYVRKRLDRAIEDVGIIVPDVGEVYYIANPGFGLAEHTIGGEFPAQPKARRDYDGVEIRLRKRMSDRWALQTSYLWSRLYGNYSGLANSDEFGRASPNVNRVFDGIYMSFDQNARPVYGRLGTDRPHQFKTQAILDLPIGTSVGVNFHAASGTPISRQVYMINFLPVFYRGRMSDGRTPSVTQTDIYIQHEFRLGGGKRFQLGLNILNLFDQDTATRMVNTENRDDIYLSDEEFFRGFDVSRLMLEQEIRRNPLFLLAAGFQQPREIRIGVKFLF